MQCKGSEIVVETRQGKSNSPRASRNSVVVCGYKQAITLGVDAGAKHIGLSASTAKQELYSAEVELRTDITKLLATRRELRSSRRSRKTRHRKARFLNRVKGKGWLAPSITNRINHECQHCHGKSKDIVLNVHYLKSRKTGGDSPSNLIILCKTCHKKYHAGEIELKQKRGQSFKSATFMGIMRWVFFNKLREIYPAVEIMNTYGYITKNTRIRLNLPKAHCIDAYCIAGNLDANHLDYYRCQRQIRKHNRQIHRLTINKGGTLKRNQSPYEVFGFRLFDKVKCKGEV